MWIKGLVLSLGALLLLPNSASAAPSINGKYAFRHTISCQATLRAYKNAGDVEDIAAIVPGMLMEQIGTATFNGVHTVTIGGFQAWGDLLRIYGKASQAMHSEPLTATWSYSNTDTTLTLNGAVYRVVYAKIVGGIAQYAFFMRNDGQCVYSGSATRKY